MKVCYVFNVRGVLTVENAQPVELCDWTFHFETDDETGFVNKLVVECRNIPKEKWPTVVEIEQDPKAEKPRFPFDKNPNAFQYSDIHRKIVNLESILSVFGLTAIDFSTMQEKWIPEGDDEVASMMAGWNHKRQPIQAVTEPLSNLDLAKCIVTSNLDEKEIAALAHFRIAQEHLFNQRFLETIRHLFFVLEHEYGPNKFVKSKQLEKIFASNTDLISTIQEVLLDAEHVSFNILSGKLRQTAYDTSTAHGFLHYIVNLRGTIQHANRDKYESWHPSRDEAFEHDAISLMNVVETICSKRVNALIAKRARHDEPQGEDL